MGNILIVEDSEDTQLVFKTALELEGYNVAVASTGTEALHFLKSNAPPALIFLDLSLPEMSGEEFLKQVRGDAKLASIKVVVVSGWDNLKVRASQMGADGFIKKPFDLSKLLEETENYLR